VTERRPHIVTNYNHDNYTKTAFVCNSLYSWKYLQQAYYAERVHIWYDISQFVWNVNLKSRVAE